MIQVTEPNVDAVNMLKSLLKKAESGEIKELAVVAIIDDDEHIVAFTDALSYHERLGLLEHMKMAQFQTVELEFA